MSDWQRKNKQQLYKPGINKMDIQTHRNKMIKKQTDKHVQNTEKLINKYIHQAKKKLIIKKT